MRDEKPVTTKLGRQEIEFRLRERERFLRTLWKENTNEEDTLDEYDFDENEKYAEETTARG